MTLYDDRSFAIALCNQEKAALAEFQNIYSDELFFVSKKFCNRGTSQESWRYNIDKKRSIKVDDNVADTYVWLVKNIVINKSCHFRGDKGASFKSYINAVLNSDFTFKDWLKWKTDDSLIKVPGATGYVPRCIKELDQTSIKIFKLLRQKKSDHDICNRLGIDYMDYLNLYNLIEKKLLESNQIQLINFPRKSSLRHEGDDGETKEIELSGSMDISPEKFPEFEVLQSMIELILNDLDKEGKKILILWASGYSADEINDELTSRLFYKSFNEKHNLKNAKSIYPFIEKQIASSVNILKGKFPEYHDTYKIDKPKMKRLLKTYFHNFT